METKYFNEFEPIQVSVNSAVDYSHLNMGFVL